MRANLVDDLVSALQHSQLNGTDLTKALSLYRDVVSCVLRSSGEPEALAERMQAGVRALNGSLFDGVNVQRTDPAFLPQTDIDGLWATYSDGRAVHLELGTWTTWPDDRADAYVSGAPIGDIIRVDMQAKFHPDIAASVTALPFADESIDRISSNSLMEHCAYPHDMLKEALRVLRPGGAIFTTVPFHFVEHGCPKDYLRFTGQFFEDVCRDLGFERVYTDTKTASGIFYTTHQLLKGGAANEEAPLGHHLKIVHTALLALLASLTDLDPEFHAHGASLFHSTRSLAIKPGTYTPRNDMFDRSTPFYKRFADYIVCPQTLLPVRDEGDDLVSICGSHRYSIVDGVPEMFVLHGPGSSIRHRVSSRQAHATLGLPSV